MKVKFYYKRSTYGPFQWSAYALIPEIVEKTDRVCRIESEPSMFKWGARWSLRRRIRSHLKRGYRKAYYEEMVSI